MSKQFLWKGFIYEGKMYLKIILSKVFLQTNELVNTSLFSWGCEWLCMGYSIKTDLINDCVNSVNILSSLIYKTASNKYIL